MKIKTCDLEGAALDWTVAKLEKTLGTDDADTFLAFRDADYAYSTDGAKGSPIIERERIATLCPASGDFWDARDAKTFSIPPTYWRGETHLIAAMRCYVASKLGDVVDVPDEVKG